MAGIKPLKKYSFPTAYHIVISQKGRYEIPQQVFFHTEKPQSSATKPVKNELRYPNFLFKCTKNGIWTASYNRQFGSEYIKRHYLRGGNRYLQLYAVSEENGKVIIQGWLLDPKENSRVYVINDRSDFLYLFEHFPFDPLKNAPTIDSDYFDYETMNRIVSGRYFLDYEAIAKEWDCVYLTMRGKRESGNDIIDFTPGTCVWFSWCFDSIRGPIEYDISGITKNKKENI